MNKKKLLAIASGGGHWVQLMRLRDAFDQADLVLASVQPKSDLSLSDGTYYRVKDVTRFNKYDVFRLTAQIFSILWKERPDVIISTGALPGLVALALGRAVFGCKTIWIDSVANCEHMSTSGRMARHFSTHWLTQWPHVAGDKGPECWGSVL